MSEWHLNLWSGISAWDESGRRLITNISKLCWVWLLNILKEVCLERERERKEGGREGRKETHSQGGGSVRVRHPSRCRQGLFIGDCKGKFPSKFLKFLDCIQEMRFANAGSVLTGLLESEIVICGKRFVVLTESTL